jgi:hypothetical protein
MAVVKPLACLAATMLYSRGESSTTPAVPEEKIMGHQTEKLAALKPYRHSV